MICPSLLSPGNTIGILAPARKIHKSYVDFAAQVLAGWGLQVVISKNICSTAHSYFSGSDEERLEDLQQMINDPGIHAVICARGGYGSTRIIDRLDLSVMRKNPKWIIGFSDITALHLKLIKEGVASIHGPMPILFDKEDSVSSVESLRIILMAGECKIEALASGYNRQGSVNAMVIGGNLSLLVDALGTATGPDTRNKILILEEVDEYLYKLDRMMTQLKRAGKLENLAGLVIGHFTSMKDTELPFGKNVQEIILDAVHNYSYPVAFGFPSGHENPNMAWIHGGEAVLSVNDTGTKLTFKQLQKVFA